MDDAVPTWSELVDSLGRILAQSGHDPNRPAWEVLHEWLHNRASLILRRYGASPRLDADDAVQDVLIKLHSSAVRQRLLATRAPEGYLTVLLRNCILDALRLDRAEDRRAAGREPMEQTGGTTLVPHEEIVALRKAIARLSPEEQRLLRLRFWEDHSIGSIAAELGINYSAAAVRMFRLVRKLRLSV